MNSAAELKAFCGRNGGIVCTSSNAPRVFDWAFERGEQDPLLPGRAPRPQHRRRRRASRWTRWSSGIRSSRSAATPRSSSASARVILWKGYCSVHMRFTVEQIEEARGGLPGRQRHRPPGVPARGGAGRRHATARPSSSSRPSARRRPARPGRSAPRSIWSTGSSRRCRTRRSSASTRWSAPARPCTGSTRPTCSGCWSICVEGEVVNQITVDPETAEARSSRSTGCWRYHSGQAVRVYPGSHSC